MRMHHGLHLVVPSAQYMYLILNLLPSAGARCERATTSRPSAALERRPTAYGPPGVGVSGLHSRGDGLFAHAPEEARLLCRHLRVERAPSGPSSRRGWLGPHCSTPQREREPRGASFRLLPQGRLWRYRRSLRHLLGYFQQPRRPSTLSSGRPWTCP